MAYFASKAQARKLYQTNPILAEKMSREHPKGMDYSQLPERNGRLSKQDVAIRGLI